MTSRFLLSKNINERIRNASNNNRSFATGFSHSFVLSHPSQVDAKSEMERERGRIVCVTSGKGGVVSLLLV